MTDKAFQKAKAKRASLVNEIERIDVFLRMYQEFSDDAEVDETSTLVSPEANLPPVQAPPTTAFNTHDRFSKGAGAKISDAAELAIQNAERPLPRGELFKAIEDMGVRVGGKDPVATLSSALWREKNRFVSIKGHGYWLKDQPYLQAHYHPDMEDLMGVTESEGSDETAVNH